MNETDHHTLWFPSVPIQQSYVLYLYLDGTFDSPQTTAYIKREPSLSVTNIVTPVQVNMAPISQSRLITNVKIENGGKESGEESEEEEGEILSD